jgi:hypothetical protein
MDSEPFTTVVLLDRTEFSQFNNLIEKKQKKESKKRKKTALRTKKKERDNGRD